MSERTLNGRCGKCDHVWPVAYLPQSLATVAKLCMDARCPKGCDSNIFVAGVEKANG